MLILEEYQTGPLSRVSLISSWIKERRYPTLKFNYKSVLDNCPLTDANFKLWLRKCKRLPSIFTASVLIEWKTGHAITIRTKDQGSYCIDQIASVESICCKVCFLIEQLKVQGHVEVGVWWMWYIGYWWLRFLCWDVRMHALP